MSLNNNVDQGFVPQAASLLSKKDFNKLKKFFQMSTATVEQHTSKILIDENWKMLKLLPVGAILRICSGDEDVLELKLHGSDGKLERFTTTLSDKEYDSLFDEGVLPEGLVKQVLDFRKILSPFTFLGTIDRMRSMPEIRSKPKASLVFDETYYTGGHIDYEIKITGNEYAYLQSMLETILNEQVVSIQPAPLKIQRFYTAIGMK
jgi:uncharacterized protein YjbK